MLLEHADRIQILFKKENVPLLFIKGCAFLDTIYSDISQRKMCDIDVLIQRKDKKQATKLLTEKGFRLKTIPKGRGQTIDEHYNMAFEWIECPKIMVELHTELCQKKRFKIDYDDFFKRSKTRLKAGREIPTLDSEDSVLSLILHAAKESFLSESMRLNDAKLIFETWKPNLSLILKRAKQYGFYFAAVYYLTLLFEWMGNEDTQLLKLTASNKLRFKTLKLLQNPHLQAKLHRRVIQLACIAMTADDIKEFVNFLRDYGRRRIQDGNPLAWSART